MPHEIPEDAVYPRDAEHRYRLYARRDDELQVLAVGPDGGSIGCAIVQLHEDEKGEGRRLSDLGVIGVLDAVDHEWVVLPWERGRTGATT